MGNQCEANIPCWLWKKTVVWSQWKCLCMFHFGFKQIVLNSYAMSMNRPDVFQTAWNQQKDNTNRRLAPLEGSKTSIKLHTENLAVSACSQPVFSVPRAQQQRDDSISGSPVGGALVSLTSDKFEYTKQSLLNEWGMSSGRGKPGQGHSCFPVLARGGVTLDKETAGRVWILCFLKGEWTVEGIVNVQTLLLASAQCECGNIVLWVLSGSWRGCSLAILPLG